MTLAHKSLLALLILLIGASLASAGRLEFNAGPAPTVFISSTPVATDTLIKTGQGYLQCIIFSQQDAAPTAGTIEIRNAVAAGAGSVIFSHVFTTAVFMPFQVCPQRSFGTGLYIDFTTTADVYVVVSYQ